MIGRVLKSILAKHVEMIIRYQDGVDISGDITITISWIVSTVHAQPAIISDPRDRDWELWSALTGVISLVTNIGHLSSELSLNPRDVMSRFIPQ